MRSLTTDVGDSLISPQVYPAFLVSGKFDSGTLNLWTGYGEIVYNGITYTGSGGILSFTEIVEKTAVEAISLEVVMSGISSTMMSIALGETYQSREFTLALALFQSDMMTILDNPIDFVRGKMDVMTVELDPSGEKLEISMTVEASLIDLSKSFNRYYTSEDQKLEYPADTGFDFITYLQDKEILWGRAQ